MSNTKFAKILAATAAFVAIICLLTPVAGAQANLKTLLAFTGDATGFSPESNLIFDSAGNLYGTTGDTYDTAGDKVFELIPNSDGTWTENILWSSAGGSEPYQIRAGATWDSQGNLWSTGLYGGAHGCGQVFKLSPNGDGTWTYTDVLDFDCGAGGSDSCGGVIFDGDGNLYGTTSWGGIYNWGTVYELLPNPDGSWREKILHNFTSGKDGENPGHGNLVFDAKGALYGNAAQGAEGNCQAWETGCGTVFKLSPNSNGTWTFTVIHSFTGGDDGGIPNSTMTFDKAGNLYGATLAGGNTSCTDSSSGLVPGCGVVFELIPGADGKWTEKVLHKFENGEDGAYGWSGVIFDKAGNMYGDTIGGGNTPYPYYGGCGTVYELLPNGSGGWTERILVRFDGEPQGTPYNSLLMDHRGNLYGTTSGVTTPGLLGGVYELIR